MGALDSYLVSIGIKGQDAVLTGMKKIRKEGEALSKAKIAANLAAPTAPGNPAAPTTGAPSPAPIAPKPTEEEKTGQKSFKDAAKDFKTGVKNFGNAAASLDPTSTIQAFSSAVGTSLSGISVLGVSLGRLPEGIAALSNTTLTMAKNAVDMAKQSTMAYHQLADRNAATAHYGGNLGQGQLSNAERAAFAASLSGSVGVIGKPLAAEINKLMGSKDTGALARAAAGDWESTGTDKGWVLQQISNGMQGLPPSIKQSVNAALLRQNSGEIQDITGDQYMAQKNAGRLSNMEEGQTASLYKSTLDGSGNTKQTIIDMTNSLNNMQDALMTAGLAFSTAITSTVTTIKEMPASIEKMRKAMDNFSKDASKSNLENLKTSVMRLLK